MTNDTGYVHPKKDIYTYNDTSQPPFAWLVCISVFYFAVV